jgi:glycosyltransferase involved in cell wall biosynthesis
VDNDPAKQGSLIENVPIISAEKLLQLYEKEIDCVALAMQKSYAHDVNIFLRQHKIMPIKLIWWKSVIAYYLAGYPEKRLVIDKIERVKYVKLSALNDFLLFVLRFLKKIGVKNLDKFIWNFSFSFFGRLYGKPVCAIHFFNQVYLYSSKKWISSVETTLPRYEGNGIMNKMAIKAMASPNCKAILPLSKCSYNMELNVLESFPKYKEAIIQKMRVLHPPQELLINDISLKRKNDKLTFCFIGNNFLQKAGMETLYAFEKIAKTSNIKLRIVSHMIIDRHHMPYYNEQHKKLALNFFAKNSDWIDFHNGLSNNNVLEIIKESDIGLLPTKADTYGFSVLEMQAAGTPVITTNVRALPEINNNECGWIIPVTKNKFGEALYSNEQEFQNLSMEIENGLYIILVDIMKEYQNSGINFIREKGKKSLERIAAEHNPKNYGKFLENLICNASISPFSTRVLELTYSSDISSS